MGKILTGETYRPLWIAALALLVLPFALQAVGLTLTSTTDVVIFAIAAMGLNLLVGYTGLTSFGHGAWFGLGSYAAALSQKYWFTGQIVLPLLFSLAFVAALAALVGFLILRRRGVYFSLLTLALSALTFAIAFRWTAFTGGESGLGGIVRPAVGPLNLENPAVYLALVSLIGFAVLYVLLRVTRSPFGHVIVAIRENEQRALFQGYDTQKYKLGVFVLSATVTGLAGALLVFHHRIASAEPTSVAFSGELLAIVVIGGMRSVLGPALGALFSGAIPSSVSRMKRCAAANAMLVASAVLPMPGRPARIVRSLLCSPPILALMPSRPVVTPDRCPPEFKARSACLIASWLASPKLLTLLSLPPSSATR